jgi:hypothetical protein
VSFIQVQAFPRIGFASGTSVRFNADGKLQAMSGGGMQSEQFFSTPSSSREPDPRDSLNEKPSFWSHEQEIMGLLAISTWGMVKIRYSTK